MSYRLDYKWLQRYQRRTGGEIFLVSSDQVLDSSVTETIGIVFKVSDQRVVLDNHTYRVHPLELTPIHGDAPQLWFALHETSLMQRLEQHRITTLIGIGLSLIVILIFGFIIMRNFSKPLSQLMSITREVAQGHLPLLDKSVKKDEITELSNHFADMLMALREKQHKIDLAHAELERTAITDSLTGLYNRRQLIDVFPKLLAQAQRSQQLLFAILIDLDKFKHINDKYGHMCGDAVLEHFSTRLFEVSRANDYLFRMGSEEFLLLTVSDDTTGIFALAEKVRQTMEQACVDCDGDKIHFTISSGISTAALEEMPAISLRNMLTRADTALYRAKQTGRNQFQIDKELAA